MGYSLNAFIGPFATLEAQMAHLPASKLVRLKHGLAMLPLSYETREALDQSEIVEPFFFLPDNLFQIASKLSLIGSLGYVEVDFFGGTGQQTAILWKDAATAWGPAMSKHDYNKQSEGAVNQLLQLLDVRKTMFCDEFETVGLNRFRSDEDWLSSL